MEWQAFQAKLDVETHCGSAGLVSGRPPPKPELPATIGEVVSACDLLKSILVQNRHKEIRRIMARDLDGGMINAEPGHVVPLSLCYE
jgi:hypothetical protein